MGKRLDRYEFIWKAIQKHGYKYDYRKVEYKDAKTKVCIICHKHGDFFITPDNHLHKKGCSKCNNGITLDINEFINRANLAHNNKFDYSKVVYINNRTKVCIVCPVHGEFYQIPDNHLKGVGCSKCNGGVLLTTEEFIKNSKKVHKNDYDYSKVKYINNRTKVCIICKKHGEYYQIPYNHLMGKGCPICNESYLEKQVRIILEDEKIKFIPQYKLTFTKNGKGIQTLDFYLSDYQIGIECQGEQHFEPVDFSCTNDIEKANKHYEYVKKLDANKLLLCNYNNIEIIYVNYFDTEEEKINKIKNILNR